MLNEVRVTNLDDSKTCEITLETRRERRVVERGGGSLSTRTLLGARVGQNEWLLPEVLNSDTHISG